MGLGSMRKEKETDVHKMGRDGELREEQGVHEKRSDRRRCHSWKRNLVDKKERIFERV